MKQGTQTPDGRGGFKSLMISGREGEREEDLEQRDCKSKLIIRQNSQWKAIFDVWMLGLVGYSCFTTIFYVAFGMPGN